MSDHEENFNDTRFSTPVPELDDHRHQSASVQRTERSRRGTIDTLYGTMDRNAMAVELAQVNEHLLDTNARDFEEAIVDGEFGGPSPIPLRSRRPTAVTADSRETSPPNSVKAFAQARRRERDPSPTSSRNSVRAFAEARRYDQGSVNRKMSVTSQRSHRSLRSRRYTNEKDAASLAPSRISVQDDVCFPQSSADEKRDKRKLYIDFDYLQRFIDEEERDRTPPKNQPAPRVFNDLRFGGQLPKIVDADGNAVPFPSGNSSLRNTTAQAELDEKFVPIQHHTEPNRFTFFSSAFESTIHAAEFGDLVLPGEEIRDLFKMPEGEEEEDGVWWLNMSNPSEEEIHAICKAFGIHPLTIEDIEKQETREKIELFPAYYFACFRSFNMADTEDGPELEPHNIYVIVFREGLMSFSFSPNPHAAAVRKRIGSLRDYLDLSSDWICYALIDDIVDSFGPFISKLDTEADNIDDQVFIARTDDMQAFLRKIGDCRKTVTGLMKLLGGKADVLKGFTKRCNENFRVTPRMDIGLYLGDIQDHVVTMMSNLNHLENILSRSHSNYMAQLQIDNITQGNRSNDVLSKITLLASILVPLNLVCGMFGMNVPVPFHDSNSLLPFFMILLSLVLFSVVAIATARRMRYL